MRACNHLQKLLPLSQVHIVDTLHASRGPHAKKEVMVRFRAGEILVLCSMEVVGTVRTFMLIHISPIICRYRARIFRMWMTLFNS